MATKRRNNRRTAAALFVVVGGMVGLAYASVPLYQLFCQVTGYGGTPRIASAQTAYPASSAMIKGSAMITVRFDANVGPKVPWRFRPVQREVTVQTGDETLAFFSAMNMAKGDVTGTATFNVTPYKAAKYVNKIDCFCFSEQRLTAGEEVSMPVSFIIDPEIRNDPNTREVRTVTLSYTFFRVTDEDDAPKTTTVKPNV